MPLALSKSPRISWAFTRFSPKRPRTMIMPTAMTPPMITARQNAKKMTDNAPPDKPKKAPIQEPKPICILTSPAPSAKGGKKGRKPEGGPGRGGADPAVAGRGRRPTRLGEQLRDIVVQTQ